jgi:spore germination protein YaaH
VRKIAALFLLSACAVLARPKALFYMTESPQSVRSFLAHVNKVDIIVPTWYQVDANGLVWGGPNPLVLQTAKAHHVPVVPIVTNAGSTRKPFISWHQTRMHGSYSFGPSSVNARRMAMKESNSTWSICFGRIGMHSRS